MVESLQELRNQLQELWTGFDKKVKIIIISSVLITIIGLVILTTWAGQPKYSILFDNLSMKDAGKIADKLKQQNINYKLKENGSSILVPQDKVYQLRLDFASQGLPSRGVTGFEIFDRNQLGSTSFEQKVNYYRALGGELSRTIRRMNEVSYAKVQITPSQQSIYQSREKPAKASVLVKLEEYKQLARSEVRSIANLVASSVRSLSPDRVTIVDSQSNLLSAKLEVNQQGIEVSNHLEIMRNFEAGIKKDLNVMLTKVLGINDFVVTVNASLNFNKRKIRSKEYEPVVGEEGIARSKEVVKESQQGVQSEPKGVPGTTSNIPQYKVKTQSQSSSERTKKIINYEINKQVKEFTKALGTLERLSVSVMVDSKQLSQQKKEAIKQAVSAAVGYKPKRGDEISVIGMAFSDQLQQQTEQALAAQQGNQQRLLWIIAAVVFGAVILLGIAFFRGGEEEETEELEPGQEIDYMVEEAAEEEEFSVGEELSEEEKERQKLINQLQNLANEQPEEIAELIKSWMEE